MGPGVALSLCLGLWVVAACRGQEAANLCQTTSYRSLPVEVQNEHQCMVLERLQQEAQQSKALANTHFSQLIRRLNDMEHSIGRKLQRQGHRGNVNTGTGFPTLRGVPVARDCQELLMSGVTVSGVYAVKLASGLVINVYCDMATAGGGWTLVQRRHDGSLNFTRYWDDYAFGFGNVNSEFWLGNENLHTITASANYTLRVDMWDWQDRHAFATYSVMRVRSEEEDYRLEVGTYNGTAGDSLSYHHNMRFTTPDRDHDLWWANCGLKDRSGWWFNACSYSSLNGVYRSMHDAGRPATPSPDGTQTAIQWFHWKQDPAYSLKRVEMKLKPRIAVMLEDQEDIVPEVYG